MSETAWSTDSPYVGERLAAVMGWKSIPTLTPAEREEFDRKNAEAQAAADTFYAAREQRSADAMSDEQI